MSDRGPSRTSRSHRRALTHLDTSFLVDLLRERKRRTRGPAHELLTGRLANEELAISVHVACDFHASAELASNRSRERKRVQELGASLQVMYPDEACPLTHGMLLAHLRRTGEPIATMDLLIATAAVRSEAPLVTRNPRHFFRVPGLELIEY